MSTTPDPQNKQNPLDPELDPNVEWTPEKLQQKLHEYHKAVQEEFSSDTTVTTDPKQAETYTRDFFKKNLANALAQIVWLANNSTSDSVRLSAADKIVKYSLEDSKNHGDPIQDLVNELTGVVLK